MQVPRAPSMGSRGWGSAPAAAALRTRAARSNLSRCRPGRSVPLAAPARLPEPLSAGSGAREPRGGRAAGPGPAGLSPEGSGRLGSSRAAWESANNGQLLSLPAQVLC